MSEPIFIKCDRLLTKTEQERFMYEIKKKMDGQSVILLPPYMDVVHPAQRWIPVTERLPDRHGAYLVYDKEEVLIGYYSTFDRDWTGMNGFSLVNVTAWMPLPEPYTEVKSNDNDQ